MAFDEKAFDKAKFEPREAEVELPNLSIFFDEEEEPIFKVKSLIADEIAKCNNAVKVSKTIKAVVEAITGQEDKKKVEAVKEMVGFGDSVQADTARKIELLIYGLVEPKLTRQQIVKLGNAFPEDFYTLAAKITELTGLGQEVGKQKPSGKKTKSKQV